jgi:hypothetical protein
MPLATKACAVVRNRHPRPFRGVRGAAPAQGVAVCICHHYAALYVTYKMLHHIFGEMDGVIAVFRIADQRRR